MPEEITFDQLTDPAPVAEAPKVEETKPPEGEVGQEQVEQGEEKQRDEKGRFKGVQTRIDELTRARHEAEREAAYWRGLADQSKAQPPAPDTAKPVPEKFSDYSAYVEALAEWKADQRVAEALNKREAQDKSAREATERQSKAETFDTRRDAYRGVQKDFDEVMNTADFKVSPAVMEVIQDSESGPALAYHLAKNPDEALRISKLSPLGAARELGKIEAGLSTAKPVQKSVTKAPAPITPVGSGRSSTPDINNMTQAEYEAFRGKQGAWWAR